MKFFDKLWKKIVTGILGTILFVGVCFYTGGRMYYNSILFANVDEWDILEASDGEYCYAFKQFEHNVILSVALIEHNNINFLSIQIDNATNAAGNTEPFSAVIGFSDESFNPQDPINTMNGMVAASATIDNGSMGIVAAIPPSQGKQFWQMLHGATLMIIKLPSGMLSFDVSDIRTVLIKSLECKAVKYDSAQS